MFCRYARFAAVHARRYGHARACEHRSRQDRARRVRHTREPQLQWHVRGVSERVHGFERKELARQEGRAPTDKSQEAVRHRSLGRSNVRGMQRAARRPSRNALQNERLRPRGCVVRRAFQSAVRLHRPQRVEAVLRHGASVGAGGPDVRFPTRREFRRAPIHHRGAGEVER